MLVPVHTNVTSNRWIMTTVQKYPACRQHIPLLFNLWLMSNIYLFIIIYTWYGAHAYSQAQSRPAHWPQACAWNLKSHITTVFFISLVSAGLRIGSTRKHLVRNLLQLRITLRKWAQTFISCPYIHSIILTYPVQHIKKNRACWDWNTPLWSWWHDPATWLRIFYFFTLSSIMRLLCEWWM